MTLAELCGIVPPHGGMGKVEYLPLAWLDVATYEWMINDSAQMVGNVAAVADKSWLVASLRPNDRTHTDTITPDAQGGYHTRPITGAIACNYADAAPLLAELRTHRYLTRITDRAGRIFYLNSAEHPAIFTGGYDGGNLTGRSVTNITFTVASPQVAATAP